MDVVLIDPPTSHEQIYGDWDLSKVDTYCPPLGLLSIASFLRENGHTPHVLDLTARNWSLAEAVDDVARIQPGFIGISAKTINIRNAAILAERIKQAGMPAPVVIGGAHMTAIPAETMRRFSSIDIGVIGEGEMTALELVTRAEENVSLKGVNGTVHRDDFNQPVINKNESSSRISTRSPCRPGTCCRTSRMATNTQHSRQSGCPRRRSSRHEAAPTPAPFATTRYLELV